MTDATAGAPPQKSSSGLLKLLGLGCCGCLFLFAAFLAVAIGVPLMLTGPAVDAARRHLADAGRDPTLAYGELASVARSATSEAEFKAFVAAHPEYYQAADLSFSNRSFENGLFVLSGTATAKDGTQVPIRVELVKEGEVVRVRYVGPPP